MTDKILFITIVILAFLCIFEYATLENYKYKYEELNTKFLALEKESEMYNKTVSAVSETAKMREAQNAVEVQTIEKSIVPKNCELAIEWAIQQSRKL